MTNGGMLTGSTPFEEVMQWPFQLTIGFSTTVVKPGDSVAVVVSVGSNVDVSGVQAFIALSIGPHSCWLIEPNLRPDVAPGTGTC